MAGKPKHGMWGSPVYWVWNSMIRRCSNPRDANYVRYGARGIAVCQKWRTFEGFWEDMREGYEAGLSLERINNDLGYSKENCRWDTRTAQTRNRRMNRNNKSGIVGINVVAHKSGTLTYEATIGCRNYRKRMLTRDFFEACCARKSWELQVGGYS